MTRINILTSFKILMASLFLLLIITQGLSNESQVADDFIYIHDDSVPQDVIILLRKLEFLTITEMNIQGPNNASLLHYIMYISEHAKIKRIIFPLDRDLYDDDRKDFFISLKDPSYLEIINYLSKSMELKFGITSDNTLILFRENEYIDSTSFYHIELKYEQNTTVKCFVSVTKHADTGPTGQPESAD